MWHRNSCPLNGMRAHSVEASEETVVDSRRFSASKSTPAGFAMYHFGAFQVDPRTHELRRSGDRIKIQEQGFVVLLKLLEHPGELVTREELRAALWSADTFVDFDTGLNTVIKRLREVLRDSAEVPASSKPCRNWATDSSLQ